jgi:hypothetical protein
MRFNEAIDQSLAESISRYTVNIDQSREMFVAILGHELRVATRSRADRLAVPARCGRTG